MSGVDFLNRKRGVRIGSVKAGTLKYDLGPKAELLPDIACGFCQALKKMLLSAYCYFQHHGNTWPPLRQNVTFFQFIKTNNGGKRAQLKMAYMSEPFPGHGTTRRNMTSLSHYFSFLF